MLALLDLDETLIDRRSAFTRWATGFVATHGLAATDMAWLHDLDSAVRLRDEFFTKVYERFGAGGSSTALWDSYREQMPGLAETFEGVTRELELLRERGWRLFVISNGKSDNQRGKLHSTGLAELVDGSFISEDMGCRKPSAEFFEGVLGSTGREPGEPVWLVGDNPVDDIGGGQRAGFSTIWVSHGETWPPELPSPTLSYDTTARAMRHLREQP